MKHPYNLLFMFIILSVACKKEHDFPGKQPDKPVETFPEWVSYTTTNSQLADDQINAMAIDKNDVKWLGTSKGLVRFNGTGWTLFNPANSALPSPYITAVAVDDKGTVWAGTEAGLASYNGTTWILYSAANSVITNNSISKITFDAAHKTIWVGTGEGVVKINSDNHWEYIYTYGLILSMATDQKGSLWMGMFNDFAFRGMIKKYDNGQWTTYQLHDMGYPSAFPYGLAVDKNDAVIAVLAGTVVKSVIKLTGGNWEEVTRPEKATGLKTILLDGDKIWVGGKTLSVFGDKQSPVIALPGTDSPILCMALDSKGRKWLGTIYSGLVAYNP